MFELVLTLALAASPPLQQPNAPEKSEVEAALDSLREAFRKGAAPARVRAIEAASTTVDGSVIAWISKGLRDSDTTVVTASIESLRFMDHPDSLDALHRLYKRGKKLRKDEELFVRLLKAIGQHGNKRSISVLSDSAFASPYGKVVQARLLGLANIRETRSLEALIGLMRQAGRNRVQNHMHSFRLALMRLSATDKGLNQDAWMSWWNDNKRKLVVAPEPALLPRAVQRQWDSYWGNPMKLERARKRGDRGKDPERNEP